jgi:hypothetical protein
MTQKTFSQRQDLVTTPVLPQLSSRHIIIFTLFIAILASFALTENRAATNKTATSSAIPYSNSLELHYAKPWINNSASVSAANVPVSNALEMQYAQPYLTGPAVNVPSPSPMELQYVQQYLAGNAIETAVVPAYSNEMALQYAQPWLKQPTENNAEVGSPLEMQYAQPWLAD